MIRVFEMSRVRNKQLLCVFATVFLLVLEVFSSENITGPSDVSADNASMVTRMFLNNKTKENRNLISSYNEETANNLKNEDSEIPRDLQILKHILEKLKNPICIRDTKEVLDGIIRREKWALQMYESTPKFPVGILSGNYYQLGNFDECISAVQPLSDPTSGITKSPTIRGQYCIADIGINGKSTEQRVARSSFDKQQLTNRAVFTNTTIRWSVCIPVTCSNDDAKVFARELLSYNQETIDISIRVDSNKCHISQSKPFNKLEIIYGCIVGFCLVLSLLATSFHYVYMRRQKKYIAYNVDTLRTKSSATLIQVICCFSIIQNVGKWLTTKPSELNLECLCGIKFISMLFICFGHIILFVVGGPISNIDFYEQQSQQVENGMFTNNPLLVDTFLLVSGFLMCFLLLIEFDKRKGTINFFILPIARYIRLTPSYLVMIGFYCTLMIRTGDGPLWDSKVALEQERCLKSWWTNILYINNYVSTDNLCMFQSWYLAVDYHLFIIAPFFIYPLWRWSKSAMVFTTICTIIATVIPFILTYVNQYDPTLLSFIPEIQDLSSNFYFVNVYIKTHMRASSYFLGIIYGYVVYKLQTSGTKLSYHLLCLGWILCSAFGIFAMFSVCVFFNSEHVYNALEAATYAALHRVAWGIFVGWVILVCVTDNAPLINRFLSWKVFIPLSRLTYGAYLVNGFVVIYEAGTIRQPLPLSRYDIITRTTALSMFTFFYAFILCILFESPIHGLEKILLRKEKKKTERRNSSTQPIEN